MRLEIPLVISDTESSRYKLNNPSSLVNLYVQNEDRGAENSITLVSTPACSLAVDLGTNHSIQGLHEFGGYLFAISNNTLYQIDIQTKRYSDVGNVYLNGRVRFANNGFEMVMVNGFNAYIFSFENGLTQIEDEDFYQANAVAFLDQYLIFNRKGTGQFFLSQIANGYSYDALDFATAESAPDDTLDLIEHYGEIWLFGEKTTEVWGFSGEEFPFSRNQSAYIERGIYKTNLVVKAKNNLYWVGDDGVVYVNNGYQYAKVSNLAVDHDIASEDMQDASMSTYSQEGRHFVILNIPKANKTWCLDTTNGLWHIRSHKEGRHLGEHFITVGAKAYCGDYRKGNIYQLDLDAGVEDGEMIERSFVTPSLSDKRRFLTLAQLDLEIELGHVEPAIIHDCGHPTDKAVNSQAIETTVQLYWSDDGWQSKHTKPRRALKKQGSEIRLVRWHQLGQARRKSFEFTVKCPYALSVNGLYAELM